MQAKHAQIKNEGKTMIYERFVEDYNNKKITSNDIKRKNKINNKQYTKLRNKAIKNKDIPDKRYANRNNAKYYTKNKNGTYKVQKTIQGNKKIIGTFHNEKTAKMIVTRCIEVDWSINKIQSLIDLYKVQPKNYSLVNGYYVIQKVINGQLKTFYRVKQSETTEEEVKEWVNVLRECNWSLNKAIQCEA